MVPQARRLGCRQGLRIGGTRSAVPGVSRYRNGCEVGTGRLEGIRMDEFCRGEYIMRQEKRPKTLSWETRIKGQGRRQGTGRV